MSSKPVVLVDMDDTLAAFIGDERLHEVPIVPTYLDYPAMHLPGFFRQLKPLPGAIEAVKALMALPGIEVYICSVPLAARAHSYSEKIEWIQEHLPDLVKRVILTQDKTMVAAHYLIDDSLSWKEKWERQGRAFVHFNPRKPSEQQWAAIVEYFSRVYGGNSESK